MDLEKYTYWFLSKQSFVFHVQQSEVDKNCIYICAQRTTSTVFLPFFPHHFSPLVIPLHCVCVYVCVAGVCT